MHNTKMKLSISLGLFCVSAVAYAQPSVNYNKFNEAKSNMVSNPYSRFGHGSLFDLKSISGRAIGGAVTAYNNPFTVNNYNPATYSFLKPVVFDMGVEANSSSFNINKNKFSSNTFTISYLTFGIPIGKNAGFSFGFRPTASMYYDAVDSANKPGIGNVLNVYNGKGAMNNAYLGVAYKIKGFSLGVNASYHFGNYRYTSAMENNDSLSVANTDFAQYNYINGFDWKIGALYQYIIKEKYYVNIGATYKLNSTFNVTQDQYAMSYRYNVTNEGRTIIDPIDTLTHLSYKDRKGTLELPSEFSAGIHVGKSAEWNVGIDYVHSNYGNYAYLGNSFNIATATQRFSIGAEFTPNVNAEKNRFINQAILKGGIYYGNDYIAINNKALDFRGATFGASFPVRSNLGYRQMGTLNIAFDIGRLGNLADHNVQNNYFKFNIGFTINDIWFIKRKFD